MRAFRKVPDVLAARLLDDPLEQREIDVGVERLRVRRVESRARQGRRPGDHVLRAEGRQGVGVVLGDEILADRIGNAAAHAKQVDDPDLGRAGKVGIPGRELVAEPQPGVVDQHQDRGTDEGLGDARDAKRVVRSARRDGADLCRSLRAQVATPAGDPDAYGDARQIAASHRVGDGGIERGGRLRRQRRRIVRLIVVAEAAGNKTGEGETQQYEAQPHCQT